MTVTGSSSRITRRIRKSRLLLERVRYPTSTQPPATRIPKIAQTVCLKKSVTPALLAEVEKRIASPNNSRSSATLTSKTPSSMADVGSGFSPLSAS